MNETHTPPAYTRCFILQCQYEGKFVSHFTLYASQVHESFSVGAQVSRVVSIGVY
jgi:hypothetical protein